MTEPDFVWSLKAPDLCPGFSCERALAGSLRFRRTYTCSRRCISRLSRVRLRFSRRLI